MGKVKTLADKCPKCGYLSYQGGYCFGCGIYRPKRPQRVDREVEDAVEFMSANFQTQVTAHRHPYYDWAEFLEDMKAQKRGTAGSRRKFAVSITEQNLSEASLLVQGVVEPYATTSEGQLVRAFVLP